MQGDGCNLMQVSVLKVKQSVLPLLGIFLMNPCCCNKQINHKTETSLLRFPNSKKLKEKKQANK
jgi:hypothetical protein